MHREHVSGTGQVDPKRRSEIDGEIVATKSAAGEEIKFT